MLNLLIGPIANLAGTWLEGKVEKTKAETGAKVAKAKAEATIMERKLPVSLSGIWKWLVGSQSSWKDEWLVILFNPAHIGIHPRDGRSSRKWISTTGANA